MLVGGLCQQAQRRQADEQWLRRVPGREAERDAQGVLLWLSERFQPVDERRAERMRSRERRLEL